ncbi:MAG: DUF2071 domain-containing protein [Pirellulales bacterium]
MNPDENRPPAVSATPLRGRFLTAHWRWLAMLNFELDPALLRPLVPRGVELDFFNGRCYASVVGFLFVHTRVLGVPIPLHRHFEELNLRFYVRRETAGEVRRGVVFVREIVPRKAIALVARWTYNEPYLALPMRHQLTGLPDPRITSADVSPTAMAADRRVEYGWQVDGRWNQLALSQLDEFQPLSPGSEAEFITEHYWGYCRQRDGRTVEYQVEHPPWKVAQASAWDLQIDAEKLYGRDFAAPLAQTPRSAFLAVGSPIAVRKPTRLPAH